MLVEFIKRKDKVLLNFHFRVKGYQNITKDLL
jgi:hypothetical protein